MSAQLAQTLRDKIEAVRKANTYRGRIGAGPLFAIGALEDLLKELEAAPQQEPAGYVTAIEEGKVLMLPRPSLNTDFLVPLYAGVQQEPDKLDAERWRETLMRVGATRTEWVGGGHMFIVNLKPPSNVMQGSVAQHFTATIDAAIAARKAQP